MSPVVNLGRQPIAEVSEYTGSSRHCTSWETENLVNAKKVTGAAAATSSASLSGAPIHAAVVAVTESVAKAASVYVSAAVAGAFGGAVAAAFAAGCAAAHAAEALSQLQCLCATSAGT